ncbi:MAG: aryl-sulfate sulfotransferase [Alphaproteobacteria bacterium]|nr:aryl-sulfate sulfotransferase [Alphaproteobacteria bacterium]
MLLWSIWACVESATPPTSLPGEGPLTVVVAETPNLLAAELVVPGAGAVDVRCVAEDDEGDVLIGAPRGELANVVGVAGLRPDQPYQCNVVADGRSTQVLVTRGLEGRNPPSVALEGDRDDGIWTVFLSSGMGMLWVLDPLGRPRMAVPVPAQAHADWYAEVDGTTILVGGSGLEPCWMDPLGHVLLRPEPANENHHDGQRLGDATLLLTRMVTDDDREGFAVEEVGDRGEIRWTFGSAEAVALGELTDNGWEDPFHANAVRPSVDGDSVWVSLRNLGRIVRIDRETGRVLGALGPGEAWSTPPEGATINQHDPRVLPDGRILVLDNGNSLRGYSRILELGVPEEPGPVEVLRSFTEPGWYEPVMGGVDELQDGRWAITRAHCGGEHCDHNDPEARAQLLVVDPDTSEVAWRLVFGKGEGTYRARPVDPCELLGACSLEPVDTGLPEL